MGDSNPAAGSRAGAGVDAFAQQGSKTDNKRVVCLMLRGKPQPYCAQRASAEELKENA